MDSPKLSTSKILTSRHLEGLSLFQGLENDGGSVLTMNLDDHQETKDDDLLTMERGQGHGGQRD